MIVDLRPHWWYLSRVFTFAVLAFLILIVELIVLGNTVVNLLLLLVFLYTLGDFGQRYLKWTSTNFVITTDRVIFRQGVFAKHGIEIPLERVANVGFNQTIFERMLGTGDVLIESSGRDGQQRFSDIRKPEQVQAEIHAQMDAKVTRQTGWATTGTPPPPPPPAAGSTNVAEQLEKLHELLMRGAITQVEYDAKKAQLLERM